MLLIGFSCVSSLAANKFQTRLNWISAFTTWFTMKPPYWLDHFKQDFLLSKTFVLHRHQYMWESYIISLHFFELLNSSTKLSSCVCKMPYIHFLHEKHESNLILYLCKFSKFSVLYRNHKKCHFYLSYRSRWRRNVRRKQNHVFFFVYISSFIFIAFSFLYYFFSGDEKGIIHT